MKLNNTEVQALARRIHAEAYPIVTTEDKNTEIVKWRNSKEGKRYKKIIKDYNVLYKEIYGYSSGVTDNQLITIFNRLRNTAVKKTEQKSTMDIVDMIILAQIESKTLEDIISNVKAQLK